MSTGSAASSGETVTPKTKLLLHVKSIQNLLGGKSRRTNKSFPGTMSPDTMSQKDAARYGQLQIVVPNGPLQKLDGQSPLSGGKSPASLSAAGTPLLTPASTHSASSRISPSSYSPSALSQPPTPCPTTRGTDMNSNANTTGMTRSKVTLDTAAISSASFEDCHGSSFESNGSSNVTSPTSTYVDDTEIMTLEDKKRVEVAEGLAEEERRVGLRFEAWAEYQRYQLRFRTGTVAIYLPKDYPFQLRHPKHAREWTSKNLWCYRCEGRCTLCNSHCCIHHKAEATIINKDVSDNEKRDAAFLKKQIKQWHAGGVDEPTFYRCTNLDCHHKICPDCCGKCPVEICQDIQCKKCKPDCWGPCEDIHDVV